MKKVLFAAAAASVALLSTGAVAQMPHPTVWHGGHGWDSNAFWRGAPDSPRERIQFLQNRVNRGMADGSLDRREGMRVTRDLNGVRQWIRQMHWQGAGHLTPDQRARIQGKLDQISQQIHWMHHHGW